MSKKELLFSITKKDFDIQFFSGTGAGGQHRNKHQNCVRLHHRDSGVTVTGQSNKSRIANQKEAFENLTKHAKFKVWHARKIQEVLEGKSIEQKVDETMKPKNLKVEGKDDHDRWSEMTNEEISDEVCNRR